jgi:hypothetical protein
MVRFLCVAVATSLDSFADGLLVEPGNRGSGHRPLSQAGTGEACLR